MMTLPIAMMMMEDGDDRSFMEKLYIQHRYLLFRTAYNIVRHPQTAEKRENSPLAGCSPFSLAWGLQISVWRSDALYAFFN